jgi:hypothetical protein
MKYVGRCHLLSSGAFSLMMLITMPLSIITAVPKNDTYRNSFQNLQCDSFLYNMQQSFRGLFY